MKRGSDTMTAPELDNTLRSVELTLRAERRSKHTIRQYLDSTTRFIAWLPEGKWPEGVTRVDVKDYLVHLISDNNMAPATVRHHFAGIRAVFARLVEDDVIPSSPCDKVRAPKVDATPKDIVPVLDMAAVLTALDKAKDYRAAAIISLLYDTGMRAAELTRLCVEDVDLRDEFEVLIRSSKNGDVRSVPIDVQTAKRIDRWLRHRRDKGHERLFTGERSHVGHPLTPNGLFQIVRSIFRDAGIEGSIGPHDLRHTFATTFMGNAGAQEGDLMMLGGWRSPEIARHYAKAARAQHAKAAHRRFSPVGKLG